MIVDFLYDNNVCQKKTKKSKRNKEEKSKEEIAQPE